MEKIWGLVNMHYPLQNNKAKLEKYLFYKYMFLDFGLDKIQT